MFRFKFDLEEILSLGISTAISAIAFGVEFLIYGRILGESNTTFLENCFSLVGVIFGMPLAVYTVILGMFVLGTAIELLFFEGVPAIARICIRVCSPK